MSSDLDPVPVETRLQNVLVVLARQSTSSRLPIALVSDNGSCFRGETYQAAFTGDARCCATGVSGSIAIVCTPCRLHEPSSSSAT
jgi:hypothetical protein